VEFNFSIGDPRLHLEMILPEPAFAQFCADNAVQMLDSAVADAVAREERKWQYGDETAEA
jgi:phenol hydroxylase P0 protein